MTFPAWERAATDLLRLAERSIRLVATCRPQNLEEELAALQRCFPRAPDFVYQPMAHPELEQSLARMADELQNESPLGALYGGRARELCLEAKMCAAVGTGDLATLAAQRYEPGNEGDALAREWLAEPTPATEEVPRSRSDDPDDPASLLSCMRRVVGERRLPLRVASAPLHARAATGAGVVLVAQGQWLSAREVDRTVHHEIEGHALPRVRSQDAPLGIFRVGTARGAEDQEGYAIALEEEAGWLDDTRRRELAWRHLGARSVRHGADFVESATMIRDLGAPLPMALRIAARVHRAGGLAREIVYLPAFRRAREALSDRGVRAMLGSGRVAISARDTLLVHVPHDNPCDAGG